MGSFQYHTMMACPALHMHATIIESISLHGIGAFKEFFQRELELCGSYMSSLTTLGILTWLVQGGLQLLRPACHQGIPAQQDHRECGVCTQMFGITVRSVGAK